MDLAGIRESSNAAGIEFVLTELKLAKTFLEVGDTARHSEQKLRCYSKALKAYLSVMHFLQRLHPSIDELASIDLQLKDLKERLTLLDVLA